MPAARGFFTVRAGWGLGEVVVDRRGAGNSRLAAIGISTGVEGTNAEGQEGEKGMPSPKRDQVSPGRRPGDPVANEAVAASRTTLYSGHEAPGLIRSRPPAT